MLRFWSKKSKNGGFSLAELLAVVAILGILAAIAIPSAVTIQRDLKLMELNDTARQIFIAAQNQLTALRAANGLDAVKPESGAEKVDTLDGMDNIYYAQSKAGAEDTQFAAMMPTGAIDSTILDGEQMAVIEYNPESASVYAVFYAEAPYTYDPADMPRNDDAGQTKRRENLLGYYGGDAADVPTQSIIKEPDIHLYNQDELYLEIDNSKFATDAAYKKILDELRYTIKITETDDPKNAVTLAADQTPFELKFENDKCVFVLDSIVGMHHFADVAVKDGAVAITPGADITVSVEINYSGNGVVAKAYKWNDTQNSLFASRNTDKGEIEISNGRHLQNLEHTVSKVPAAGKYAVAHVVQTEVIDWKFFLDKTITAPGGGSFDANGKPVGAKELAPKGYFVSIYNQSMVSYDGRQLGIVNLQIAVNKNCEDPVTIANTKISKYAGLFAKLQKGEKATNNAVLKNIALINTRVYNDQETMTSGTLAGYLEKVDVINCSAYVDLTLAPDKNNKEQLKQYGIFVLSTLQSGSLQGGLIGAIESGKMEKCFAALPLVQTVSSFGRAGGLVSAANNTTITCCYANNTKVSGGELGGFAFTVTNGLVQECYAVGTLAVSATSAGFVTLAQNSKIYNSYAAMSYEKTYGEHDWGFAIRDEKSSSTFNGCFYVVNVVDGATPGQKGKPKEDPPNVYSIVYYDMMRMTEFGGTVKDENGDTSRAWTMASPSSTKPYDMKPKIQLTQSQQEQLDVSLYDTQKYPFPRLAAFNHYGDWVLPAKTGALVYYEMYTDDTVGLEGYYRRDGKVLENVPKLSNEKIVKRDGYAWVGIGTGSVKVTWDTQKIEIARDSFLSEKTNVAVYPMPTEIVQSENNYEQFYQEAIIDGSRTGLWFNPHFAKAIPNQQQTVPENPKTVIVRSPRQLVALGNHAEYWGYSIAQQLDLDYTLYDENYLKLIQTPIGTDKSAFSGSYDGRNHTITSAGFTSTIDDVGLFGNLEGQLSNIVLRANQLGATIKGGNQVTGALVGLNTSGTITNCAVAGFTVISENGSAGGLVGQNRGTIEASYADNASVTGFLAAGGLVGISSENATINSCHVLGAVNSARESGGLIGYIQGAARITNSYSACTFGEGAQSVDPFCGNQATVQNCYYLKNTAGGRTSASSAQGLAYDELSSKQIGGAFGTTLARSVPYVSQGDYPFPITNKVHYGDWPEKGEEPNTFGNFEIGVAVQQAGGKSFKIWGVDDKGMWSETAIDTVTPKEPETTYHILICMPKQGEGVTKHAWRVWNESISQSAPWELKKKYSNMNDQKYEYFYFETSWSWNKTNYFYNSDTDATGNPPEGWLFSITVAENHNPVYVTNPDV